ncbi:MAG: CPBP family intramembrane metalloprotease [Nannocystaceae bacterium]|nr:CPBP family intramembrane metalloprotease [Nannocystaceae bacterium]
MPDTKKTGGLLAFFTLSCAITWACALPTALAFARHEVPGPTALSLAGLSAFGPMLAAVFVAARHRQVGAMFRPWRGRWRWVVIALFTPMALQLTGKLLAAALGWPASVWVNLPVEPQHVAALILLCVGEEFGWRGFAHPRVVARYGSVRGSLLLGGVWAVWHAMYLVSPHSGTIDPVLSIMMLSIPPYAILYAWLLERGGGSLAIALALHAGAHLDNINRLPAEELGVRVITLILVAVAATLAARSLRSSDAVRRRAQPRPR